MALGEAPEPEGDGAGRRVLVSISEEESSSPWRRRVMTAEDVSATPKDSSSLFRSRATTVSTEKVFSERAKRTSKNRDLLQLPPSPLSLPHRPRKRSSVKHGHAVYPIASDMEEKLMGKIKEEIGRQYGGLSRATKAAVTIQRWYRAVHMKRHYRMLHKMATHQPKKLRQRTQSMRQSRRFRKGDGPKQTMRKQMSILDDFPNLKEVTERVATPRSARKRDTKATTLTLVTEEQRVEFSQAQPHTQASIRKVQVTPNVPTTDSMVRATNDASGSMEESLSILSQLRPGAISEFEVFESGASERSRRESATTMRRKMNIGINYFNRQAFHTLPVSTPHHHTSPSHLTTTHLLHTSPPHISFTPHHHTSPSHLTTTLRMCTCVSACVLKCIQEAMEGPGVSGTAKDLGGLASSRGQLPAQPSGPEQGANWRVPQLHPARFQHVCLGVSIAVCVCVH